MVLKKLINDFLIGANKRRKKQINEYSFISTDDDLLSSIALAHADMARRAIGHTEEVKIESLKWWTNYFKICSPFEISNQEDFDNWHIVACNSFCNYLNKIDFPKKFKINVGRAQKVLNMTFKYLYCTDSYVGKVEKIKEFLHMTLDGYTLRWYKDQIVSSCKDLRVGDVSEWSKLEEVGKHSYIDIQKRIRKYLFDNNRYIYSINSEIVNDEDIHKNKINTITYSIEVEKIPFLAEFIVWQGEIIRANMEGLLKGINGIYKSWETSMWAINDEIKNDLKNKIYNINLLV